MNLGRLAYAGAATRLASRADTYRHKPNAEAATATADSQRAPGWFVASATVARAPTVASAAYNSDTRR